MPRCAGFCWLALIVGGLAAAAQAQVPPQAKVLDEAGTVDSVLPGPTLHFKTVKSESWMIRVKAGETKVHVDGKAEVGYLRPGLAVRFSGEFDKKGVLQSDIKDLAIFSPQGKNGLGLFADGSDDAKPVRNAAPGTSYEIRGKINSFKDNELVVTAGGKKISGKVVSEAEILVNSEDIALASKDDAVKVRAWYFDQQAPSATRPGEAVGNEITVTLSKPLAPSKKLKTPPKSTKPPKEKKEKPAPEDSPALIKDPFGVETK